MQLDEDKQKEQVYVFAVNDFFSNDVSKNNYLNIQQPNLMSCKKGEVFIIKYIDQKKQVVLATDKVNDKTGFIPIIHLQICE